MKTEKPAKIFITLSVATQNRAGNITKAEELEHQVTECVLMAEGLFRVISKVCKDKAFNADEKESNTDFTILTALSYTAEIGVALMTACTELIDQLEIHNPKIKAVGK